VPSIGHGSDEPRLLRRRDRYPCPRLSAVRQLHAGRVPPAPRWLTRPRGRPRGPATPRRSYRPNRPCPWTGRERGRGRGRTARSATLS